MKRFFNSPESIVTEALTAMARVQDGAKLKLLDGFPHIKVLMRSDWDRTKVAVVSGGGAGHEPAHAGYVGEGLLTAAVSGEVFASPSVDAVLAAILAVTGDAGCLLIVKNYTGDRLNFGLAAERAKNLGYQVEMLIVSDDIALPGINQPRGIAGTVFVHKLAGYLSEQGDSLSDIKLRVEEAAKGILSIGIAYGSCVLPGQKVKADPDVAELGLGIHGEPGAEPVDVDSAISAVDIMIERLIEKVAGNNQRHAILINNLGGATALEMSIISNEIMASPLAGQIDLVFGPAPFVTSLNMHGFSLSLIPLSPIITEALTAPVALRSWLPAYKVGQPIFEALHPAVEQKTFAPQENRDVEHMLRNICERLISMETELNDLDTKVGDGDTGTTFANGAKAILQKLNETGLPLDNTSSLFLELGQILSTAMGGSSGVLLSIFFTSAGHSYSEHQDLPSALMHAVSIVQFYGGTKAGDRTMLDVAIPAFEAMMAGQPFEFVVKCAVDGAASTANMTQANAGRSAYLRSESLTGNRDPGAVAIAAILGSI